MSPPLHGLLSSKRLVVIFTGRRSGTRYATPVNYLQRGREVLITTDSPWWRNLDGGAPVELRLRGRKIGATAEAVRDPDQVAEALTALVRDHPPYGRWPTSGSARMGHLIPRTWPLRSPGVGSWCGFSSHPLTRALCDHEP